MLFFLEHKPKRLERGGEKSVVEKEDVFQYLDVLRESGVTNMFGATSFLQEEFSLPKSEAQKLLGEWMKTYSKRHPD